MFYDYIKNDKKFNGILMYGGSANFDNPHIYDLNM